MLINGSTDIPAEGIIELVSICLCTYFRYNGSFYRQDKGTPMGSPLSCLIAETVMRTLEKSAMNKYKPKMWVRYVDDTFVIIKRTDVQIFHDLINSIYPDIQFTREEETNSQLPFLDVLVKRDPENNLRTEVYRKDAYAEVILHYDSNHPYAHKINCVTALFNRAETLCSESTQLEDEKRYLFDLFKRNGYPKSFIRNCLRKKPPTPNPVTRNEENSPLIKWIPLPYIEGVSESVARQLRKHNINIAHKPTATIRNLLVKPKDKLSTMDKTKVIYKIPCHSCEKAYCGQTGKKLASRLHEHSLAVKRHDTKSQVAMHSLETGHRFDFANTKIVGTATNKKSREFIEAWNSTDDCLNRHVDLDPTFVALKNHWTRKKPISRNPVLS
jgi:hypothetical protein